MQQAAPLRCRNRSVVLSDGAQSSLLTGEDKAIDARIRIFLELAGEIRAFARGTTSEAQSAQPR